MDCARCGEPNPPRASFCVACGNPLASLREPSRDVRKVVTVIFCDVVQSTQLGERSDPEAVRRVMTRYFDDMRAVVERHGGVVEKFIGDEVMAVFGVPAAHEDDALRAVRAGAEMRARLEQLNRELEAAWGVRLDARIGINTGAVVAGDPASGSTFVTGDAVNLAKRLEQAAEPNEILIGTATYRLVKDAITAGPRKTVRAKGKSEEVSPWRLEAVDADAAGVRRRLDAPLVDRELELMRLQAAFDAAVSTRSCRLLTVLGPAGIGKSRLAGELLGRVARTAKALTGRCLPYGDGITFWPLTQIVHEAGGEAELTRLLRNETDGELITERIMAAIGRAEAPGGEQTFWAVRRFLEVLARTQPLVLCLEDIHWATPRFLDLVDYLAGWTRDAAVLLLCLAREDLIDLRPDWASPRPGAELLVLEPLASEDAETMLEETRGDADLASETRSWIMRTAEGNPLFVEQLVAMVAEREASGEELAIPPTIQALLAARLDALDPEERSVIGRAAVIGKEFQLRAVVNLSPPHERGTVAARLMSLVRKQLIRPDPSPATAEDGFAFRHALIRDAAYGALLKGIRAELHERLARWTEEQAGDRLPELEAIVGYHLEQAFRYRMELGPADADARELAALAGRRLGAAGTRAFRRDDMQAAAALLGRAVELLPAGGSERLRLYRELGQALYEAGRREDAVSAMKQVREEAGDAGARHLEALAELELVAHAQLAGGDSDVVRRAADLAIEACTVAGDELGLARAWRRVAAAHRRAGESAAGEEAARRALTHARAAGDPQEEARAVDGLCNSLLYGPTSAGEALGVCADLLELARDMPAMEANVLGAVAGLEAMRGHFEEARSAYRRAATIYEELGLLLPLAALTQIGAPLELLAGDAVAAELEARRGHAIFDRAGSPAMQAPLIAEALLAQGRDEDSEAALGELSTSSPRLAPWQVKWRTTRARLDSRSGKYDRALAVAEEATALADATDDPAMAGDAWLALSDVFRSAGRHADALRAADSAEACFERKGHAVGMGVAALARTS